MYTIVQTHLQTVLLETDGRPLRAKIELLQGPNNCKQVVEVQCDDGREHPLYLIMETPIDSNVIRVENIASMEVRSIHYFDNYMNCDFIRTY